MTPTPSRRAFLGGIGSSGLVGVAGCAEAFGSRRGATDVVFHNEAAVSRTVEVTVTQRGGESSNIDTSLDMGPHSRQKINNEVLMNSDYDVTVTYSDETAASPYSETREWNDAGRPLHIILNDQIVFAVQIG